MPHEADPIRAGLTSYTFFLEDEPRLRDTYFERTRTYIEMYEEMIGPYPYAKFATVENDESVRDQKPTASTIELTHAGWPTCWSAARIAFAESVGRAKFR